MLMSRARCPKCKSPNVHLLENDVNIKKVKKRATINLNPFSLFTIFRIKEKKIKKKSKAKVAAALMTGGTSMLFTGGLKSNASREYHCNDCGKIFKRKR